MYVSAATIRKRYEISRSCLSVWAENGLVRFRRLDGWKRIYHIRDVESRLGAPTSEGDSKNKVIYARVSSSKQAEDLKRQIQQLQREYPDHHVYKDIGSGLNFKRKRFEALLDGIFHETIGEVVVAYRDRLCRYGFELFETFCKHHNTKIVVANGKEGKDVQSELAEDLLAVCNFFVARNNGRRSHQSKKAKTLPHEDMEGETPQVDGDGEVDLQQVSSQLQNEEVQDEYQGLQRYGVRISQPRSTEEEDGEEEKKKGKGKRKLEKAQAAG